MSERCDLLVIGGGVNGCAIARDAAGRGWSVTLVERGDLAGATSGATSKLIHGGLRYLEQREFGLVREALRERALLLAHAPHLVEPLRLILPHDASLRPRWMLRLGLFLYDRLGGAGALPGSQGVDLRADPGGAPLRAALRRGFAFHDARTDDARLVLALARDAAARGAQVRTRTALFAARRVAGGWEARVQPHDAESGEPCGAPVSLRAGALINAAGPWVLDAAARLAAAAPTARVRLVQGTHLVFRRNWEGNHGYLFQNEDRRVVFLLPWGHELALLGTTDTPLAGPVESAAPRVEEIEYLCRSAARWLAVPLRAEDALASFCGVRPLFDDGRGDPSRVSRDRRLLLDRADGAAPVLHVFGGKLTTHRALAEEALALLAPWLPPGGGPWTAAAALPGGGRPRAEIAVALRQRVPDLTPRLAADLAERHGEDALRVVGGATTVAGLGGELAPGLLAAELDWFLREEFAQSGDDVLFRRTRLGWTLPPAARSAVAAAVRTRRRSAPDRR
jgi:glycerol-3-phosphate dehydrogenase